MCLSYSMNQIQLRRTHAINEITATMKKAESEGKEINKRLFLLEITKRYGVTMRTAKEYLEVAGFRDAEPQIQEGHVSQGENGKKTAQTN